MPTIQVQNPAGAYGQTAGDEQASTIEIVQSGETTISIAGGDLVVMTGTSGATKVLRATTGVSPQLLYGVAIDAIASGGVGSICVYGPTKAAKKNAAAVSAGNLLTRSTAVTAGVEVVTAATAITTYGDVGKVIGVALADATAGDTTVDMFVVKL